MKNSNTEHNYDNEIDIIIERCARCENEVINPAKSKREIICKNCQHFSKTGKSLFETLREKQREQQQRAKERQKAKPPQYKPKTKIPFFSEKGRIRKLELASTKKEKYEQSIKENDWLFCVGCGRGDVRLENSHILSVKQRSDLENDKNNINLLCNSCHQKHESFIIPQMLELKCFEADMRYIFEHDETKFNKILFKLLDYCELNSQDKKAASILSKIEKYEAA